MNYKPHGYQLYATNKLLENQNFLLLLDMGLGKTVSTLSALHQLKFDYFEVSRVLVIAPLKVAISTWPSEIAKWDFSKEFSYSICTGSESQRIFALNKKADIYLINRENVSWLFNYYKADWPFDTVIIDESSNFKNHQSERFKALRKVRPFIKRVIELTGTPTPNGLIDLWSQVYLIDRGERLGKTISEYRNRYFTPDKSNGHIVYSYKLKDGAEQKIYDAIGDISISMKAVDWLAMPELVVNYTAVELSATELQLYKKMEREKLLEVDESDIVAVTAGVLANKLLQMSNGAVYDTDKNVVKIHDKKLEALMELVEQSNGQPIIIAYWFKHDRDRIIECLSKVAKPTELNNQKDIERWNSGKVPILLLHPASAGHGLNIQYGGNKIIWFGPIWSLEAYQQLNARLYRQGQKDKSVFVWIIIAKGTYDELVIPRLEGKELNQEKLLRALRANIASS